jgi:Sulfotransferase family
MTTWNGEMSRTSPCTNRLLIHCCLAVCVALFGVSVFVGTKQSQSSYQFQQQRLPSVWLSADTSIGEIQRGGGGDDVIDLPDKKNRTILFVHVGKAGGETIKSVLDAGCQVMHNVRRRTKCLANLPASKLSAAVVGYFHCFKVQPSGMAVSANSYLFNVRHPVDRTISWYRYVSPFNCVPGGASRVSPNCASAVRVGYLCILYNLPRWFVC